MALNTNQFEQQPVRGNLDLQISKSGVITGIISANQATALNPGDFVKLDSAATGKVPQFVAAAVGDTGIGAIIRDVRQSAYAAGDEVQIAGLYGPVLYVVASGTVAMGAALEDAGSGKVQTKAAQVLKGYALESATDGQTFRMMLTPPVIS